NKYIWWSRLPTPCRPPLGQHKCPAATQTTGHPIAQASSALLGLPSLTPGLRQLPRRRRRAQRSRATDRARTGHLLLRHRLGGLDRLGHLGSRRGVEPILDRLLLVLRLHRRRLLLGRFVAEHPVLALDTEAPGKALQGLVQVARHHPDLVRIALGHLGQRLQVLVSQQLRSRLAALDRGEQLLDRLRLTLRPQVAASPLTLRPQNAGLAFRLSCQDRGLLLTLSCQDRGLLLALSGLDRRLPLTLCGEDHRALLPVSAHLLLHRVLD